MKRLILTLSLFGSVCYSAQNVMLNSVAKVSENHEKFLYRISPDNTAAEYLGELEVQGYSPNDVEVFRKIYTKAKEIGANAFVAYPFPNLDSLEPAVDPRHYRLKLYFVPAKEIPGDHNWVYIINSSGKSQRVSYNGQTKEMPARTFFKEHLKQGEEYSISVGKFLGSKIRMSAKEFQPAQYFQISGTRVSANSYGTPGINLKSGDIIGVERSFGDFLTTVYGEIH